MSSSPLSLLPLLPLAIENRHIIYAERYLSGALRVFPSILLHDANPGPQVSHCRSSYDHMLTFGDEVRYVHLETACNEHRGALHCPAVQCDTRGACLLPR